MQQPSLFPPRIRARVQCPACRAVHILAGGEAVGCCEVVINLEENDGGGFRAWIEYMDPRPVSLKPIPQIVGWVIDNQDGPGQRPKR